MVYYRRKTTTRRYVRRRAAPYRRPATIKKAKGYVGKVTPTTLARYVKRAINSHDEVKHSYGELTDTDGDFVKSGGLTDRIGTILPTHGWVGPELIHSNNILIGPSDNNRLGNKIRVKNFYVDVVYTPYFSDDTDVSAPQDVHVMLYRNKIENNGEGLLDIKRYGPNSTFLDGTLLKDMLQFNKEYFDIYYHSWKKAIYVPSSGTNDINNTAKFSLKWRIPITKHCKRLTFQKSDGPEGETFPTNHKFYLAVWSTLENNNVPSTPKNIGKVYSTCFIDYTDA